MSNTSVLLKAAGTVVTIVIGTALLRTLTWVDPPAPDYCNPDEKYYVPYSSSLINRFSGALKFQTISYAPRTPQKVALSGLLEYITKSFPLVHSSPIVSREVVNNFSLLYHVQGSNKELKPYLLAGHLDVVPVEESKWTVDPFSGKISDGFIWGRGTMDCKHLVMLYACCNPRRRIFSVNLQHNFTTAKKRLWDSGTLEALEFLLGRGYQPQRSFYLAFGHDEEVNGLEGAQFISKLLQSRNVKLEYVLDEGSLVVDNFIHGFKSPVAFVAVSEKGSLNLELTVNDAPGHSSLPGKENAIVILSKAVSKLVGDVFPSMFGKGPEKQMLEEMAYAAPFPVKFVLTNVWLFKPLIVRFMSSPVMNAFHRTTTAVTVIKGGTKMNVLPSSATATVNLRIHPAQTVEEVLEYLKNVINDDRVEMSVLSSSRPHPVSPTDSFGYSTIKKSIQQIYNDSCVVPCTLIANTDTRWYLGLTDSIYRFSIIRVILDDLKRIHGNDERIGVKNYVELVNFFVHLMRNSDDIAKPKHVHTDL